MSYNPKFERDRSGGWSASRDANFTQVVAGSDAYLMEDDINLMQSILNEARADMARMQYHSGVLDYTATVYDDMLANSSRARNGALSATNASYLPTYANALRVYAFNAIINGYRLHVNGANGITSDDLTTLLSNDVRLPEPPTYGVRDDLVFLEAWFEEVSSALGNASADVYKYGGEQSGSLENSILDTRKNAETTRRIQLRWRIRTVAGVDFGKFPEGLGNPSSVQHYDQPSVDEVPPQGGRSGVLTSAEVSGLSVSDNHYKWLPASVRGISGITGQSVLTEDKGLYVSGKGDQASKELLKTYDGYVYAIPLFKVERRNSGGYRADNLNGADDYFYAQIDTLGLFDLNTTHQVRVYGDNAMEAYNSLKVGDILEREANILMSFQIISKDGTADPSEGYLLTCKYTGSTAVNNNNATYRVRNNRPDGKYANIVHKDDITDLRHHVRPKDFRLLMEENFDKLIRGELNTKEQPKTFKERYGLQKAPLGVPAELMGTKLTVEGSEGNLLPLFSSDRWVLHANASYILPYSLELMPTAIGESSYVDVDVKPSQTYSLNLWSTSKANVYYTPYGADNSPKPNVTLSTSDNGETEVSFTTAPDVVKIRLHLANAELGFQTFDTPQLFEGSEVPSGYSLYWDAVERELVNGFGTYDKHLLYGTPTVTRESDRRLKVVAGTSGHGIAQKMSVEAGAYYVVYHDLEVVSGQAYAGVWDIQNGAQEIGNTAFYPVDDFVSLRLFQATQDSDDVRFIIRENGATPCTFYVGEARAYKVSAEEYAFIGSIMANMQVQYVKGTYPYVDSYPNIVENLFPFENHNFHSWIQGEMNNTLVYSYGEVFTYDPSVDAMRSGWSKHAGYIKVEPNTDYTWQMQYAYGAGYVRAHYYDSNKTYLNAMSSNFPQYTDGITRSISFTTPPNCAYLVLVFDMGNGNSDDWFRDALLCETKNLVQGVYVPPGRWYLPQDTQGNEHLQGTLTYRETTKRLNGQRYILSDTQSANMVADIIDPDSKSHPPHISITQATAGRWSVGDTIKIKNLNGGLISGVLDGDTAIRQITAVIDGGTLQLDSVVGLDVNDIVRYADFVSDGNTYSQFWINSIDTTTNTVVLFYGSEKANAFSSTAVGNHLLETTASSSVPPVTGTRSDNGQLGTFTDRGSWSGLGTREATFTFSSVTTLNVNMPLQFVYSALQPAGQGIKHVPTEIYGGAVNGRKLVKGTTVSAKANFLGKVMGSLDRVAHYSHYSVNLNRLLTATEAASELNTDNYALVSKLDGAPSVPSTTTNGTYAQARFSFNVIRAIEDVYGEIPALDKKGWVGSNVAKLRIKWYGFGSYPAGNKAVLYWWNADTDQWSGNVVHNYAESSLLQLETTDIPRRIEADGTTHFILYTDPSDGVTASTINTDYVELEIELNVASTGYTILQPENPFPVLSENILPQSIAQPIGTAVFVPYHGVGTGDVPTISVESLGVLKVSSGVGDRAYQGIRIPTINIIPSGELKGEIITFSVDVKSLLTQNIMISIYDDVTGIRNESHAFVAGETKRLSITMDFADNATGFNFYVSVDGESGTIPQSSDLFLVSKLNVSKEGKTTWTAGRKKKQVLNFLGKVTGSKLENPHVAKVNNTGTLTTPSTFNSAYPCDESLIGKQDGVLLSTTASTNGTYAQLILEFDLSHLGMSLAELKSSLRKLTGVVLGYGRGSNGGAVGGGVQTKVWNPSTSSWEVASNTTAVSSVSAMVFNLNTNGVHITGEQKIYVLAHATYPSNGSILSQLWVDYVNLEVDLADYVDYQKANILRVRPETKEIKTFFTNNRSYRLMGHDDVVELDYKYVPYQGIGDLYANAKALATNSEMWVTVSTTGRDRGLSTIKTGLAIAHLPLKTQDLMYKTLTDLVSYNYENFTLRAEQLGHIVPISTRQSYNPTFGEGSLTGFMSKSEFYRDINPQKGNTTRVMWAIFLYEGELYLGVSTVCDQRHTVSLNDDTYKRDFFKLQGRPLLKGGN